MAETIFAPASGAGRAAVTVIRLSGPQAGACLDALTRGPRPMPRRASLRRLFRIGSDELIDRALVLWFPGPASQTGEDLVEFQVHGGRAVIAALVDTLATIPGVRLAEPGEFTRRAFDHGKIDLTEAEAVVDLVEAETAAQRRQALVQMDGALGRLTERWRHALVACLAHLEAVIDFADEDLPEDLDDRTRARLTPLAAEIAAHLADGRRGERLRSGVSVAIIGPPNVGKSSLLNLIARRDLAIVSARAGTTRDVIEAHLDLGGCPVVLADTAGLRDADDDIEDEGIRRARARAASADLTLAVCDAQLWPLIDPALAACLDQRSLIVVNKCDLAPLAASGSAVYPISVATGSGIDALLDELGARVKDSLGDTGAPVVTRARHRAALEDCLAAVARAQAGGPAELVAEDLRLAARALGRITGKVDVEELLEVIFKDFCIGK
ncbi:MAG: tRNA uridine-5-carboxymethylaminomethyl(34) synthesis GTPase MnmE [Azospirillum sp.]|nr:tRNA uridine-5-carboxymethylaminomethyl(34) synthesis GTPase MnmE [Azospirillum sp.]